MTVTVPQDSYKCNVESMESLLACKSPNKGVSRWHTKPVCGGVKAYNKWSLHIKNHSRFGFTRPTLLCKTLWEIRTPQGPKEVQGIQINRVLQIHQDLTQMYSCYEKSKEDGVQ